MLFALLLTTSVNAQRNWQPGSVTLSDGTQLTGEINDPGWSGEIPEIAFRQEASQRVLRYGPDKISSFRIGSTQYISRLVSVDGAPGRVNDLKAEVNYPEIKKEAFLKVLLRGTVSLYVYAGAEQRNHYFIQGPEDPDIVYLPYQPRVATVNGAHQLRVGGSYRSKLGERLSTACPSLGEEIGRVKYSERDLRDLLQTYYSCTREEPDYRQEVERGKLGVGIVAGVGTVKLTEVGQAIDEALVAASSVSPSVGLSVRYALPILNQRLSLHLTGLRTSYTVKAADERRLDINGSSTHFVLNATGYFAQLGAGYNLYNGPVKLGLQASYQFGIGWKDDYDQEFRVDGETSVVWPTRTLDGANVALGLGLTAEYRNLQLAVVGSAGQRQRPKQYLYEYKNLGVLLTYFPFQ